jgi:RNA polymerase sigma-70 factor (ECF subfamily)
MRQAQEQLIERYGGAARRYLLAALHSEDAAADVYQDFVLRFLRGDFRNADPQKGRFRAFLKTVLYRMIIDYQRARRRQAALLSEDSPMAPAVEAEPPENDNAFVQGWRDELLARTWSALDREQQESGKPLYTVLRYRVDHPDLRSPELAAGLSRELDHQVSAGNVRVMLHRAREQFAILLLDQVAQSLEDAGREELEQELIELELFEYCRPALASRYPVDQ